MTNLLMPHIRALMGARANEQRAHLAQVVIDDRLWALEAERLDQLADPDSRELRIAARERVDLPLAINRC